MKNTNKSAVRKICFTLVFFLIAQSIWGQTGPGGVGRNDGTSFLKSWLDADFNVYQEVNGTSPATDGSRIRNWSDRSGSGIVATINVDKARPTYSASNPLFNSRSAFRFTRLGGPANELNRLATNTFPVANDMTIYCVFHALLPGGGTNLPHTSNDVNPNHWYFGSGLVDAEVGSIVDDIGLTWTSTSIAGGGGDNPLFIDYTVKTPAALNRNFIGTLIKDGTTGRQEVFGNGGNGSAVTGSLRPRTAPTQFAIGSTLNNSGIPDNSFDGYIANVLIFSKVLNLAEQTIIDNYLAAKYNIALAVHDDYKMDDPGSGNYDFEMAGIGQASNGSNHTDSRGESIFQMNNPRNLQNNEFLMWAHNNVNLTNTIITDLPTGVTSRLQRTWRCSESGGDLGGVDIVVDLSALGYTDPTRVAMLIDVNNNGNFSDETPGLGLIKNPVYLGNSKFRFTNVNLANGQRFTIGVPNKIQITVNSPTICKGDQATLTANVANGIPPFKYEWTLSGSNVKTTVSTNSATDVFQPSPSNTAIYEVKVTDASSDVATVQATVNVLSPVLAGFPDVCADAGPFALSGGSPNSPGIGAFSGTGVSGGSFSPATAGFGKHTITYTYTVSGKSCDATNTQTVNEVPIMNVTPSNAPCSGGGGSLTLSGLKKDSSYVVSLSLNNDELPNVTRIADASGSILLSGMAEGSYSNIVVTNSKGCKSLPKTATLKDPEVPLIAISVSPITSCGGRGVAILRGLLPSKNYQLAYLDSTNNASVGPIASVADNNGEISINNLSVGTYKNIVVESSDGCKSNTVKAVFKDLNSPVITSDIIPITSCGGTGSVLIKGLLANTSYQVSYSDSVRAAIAGPIAMVSDNAGTIALAGLLEGAYKNIQVSVNSCTSNFTRKVLIDPAKPVITSAIVPITSCGGTGSILVNGLLANTSYQVSYSDSVRAAITGPTAMVSDNVGTISLAGLLQGAYKNIHVSINNCTSNFTREVLIDPAKPFITSEIIPITSCGGTGSVLIKGLLANTSYQVSYTDSVRSTNPGASTMITDNVGTITLAGLLQGAYKNMAVSINNCTSNVTREVLIDPLKPVISNTLNPIQTCGGTGSVIISGLASNTIYQVSYTLPNGTINGPSASGSDNTGKITIAGLVQGNYKDIFISLNNCESNLLTAVFADPAAPVIQVATTPIATCGGKGNILIKGLKASTSYLISYKDPQGIIVGPNQLLSNSTGVIDLQVVAGSYAEIVATLNNCPSNQETALLSNPVEVPSVSISPINVDICEGKPVTFNATSTNPGSSPVYEWRVNTIIQGSGSPSFTYAQLKSNDIVEVTLTSSSVCASPVTANSNKVTVKVRNLPVATISGAGDACEGEVKTLTANGGLAGSVYQWFRNGLPVSGVGASFTAISEGNYSVRISNGADCSHESYAATVNFIKVFVDAGPDRDVMLNQANTSFPVQMTPLSNGNKPQWSPSYLFDKPKSAFSIAALSPGEHILTFSDSIGRCFASDQVRIVVRNPIKIPTAISPNGDGANDEWIISGLENYSEFIVMVYNRYGNVVHKQENSFAPWNGERNGNPMPVGTYYYVVEVNGAGNHSGNLTIIR